MNGSGKVYLCDYMHSVEHPISLWLDGPCTCLAATFSALGTSYAIGFLRRAHLNKNMTAALYTLCIIDFMLMMTTILFLSIEANSILFAGKNVMFDKQIMILMLYGIRNSLAMSSTMLVIYITYIRYRVVKNPLRFASNYTARHGNVVTGKQSLVGQVSELSRNSIPPNPFEACMEHYSSAQKLRKYYRSFMIPVMVVILCFIFHLPSYFEFNFVVCYDISHKSNSMMLIPSELRFTPEYIKWKAMFTSITETIGPMLVISVLSLFTEYRIHMNVVSRRRLFESQRRSEDVRVTEQLKDKASKALAVFIVVKFLILTSLPTFIDIYELTVASSREFSYFMTILTRMSDFLVVLNSATNTLAYFGKNQFEKWLERRIRRRIKRKQTTRILQISFAE
ncbi:unnamed protein product [Caenorhabditis bovis]|uniref:G-protein coupled receptors family 1 profile domain-containing protein n=1 Tax=Caenorhabditis bovis TaxID=2654633 RepID=A0A8S1E6Y3_9PELO|nr:unnamed protein product [Caenorhabditis bovis]